MLAAWSFALLLGLTIRLAPLGAARPYISYIDEGNFLHPVARMLREGGWDPHSYMYPQLPMTVVALAARVYDPVYSARHGTPLRDHLADGQEVYDVLEPFDFLVIARVLSLLAGMGVVILTGLLARRLGGDVAGVIAVFFAALTPALALRGAIATVDPYAALFVVACLLATDVARTQAHARAVSLLAGGMAGLAFASKYPAVLVSVAFGVTMLLDFAPWRVRLERIACAAVGVLLGAAIAMPALVLNPADVVDAIRSQASIYAQLESPGLWGQAVRRAEWDLPYEHGELGLPLLAAALAGIVVALRDRTIAPTVGGWLAFAALSIALHAHQAFQPFRNLLPLVPIACIAASLSIARMRMRLDHPLLLDAATGAAMVMLFIVPLSMYARERMELVDSRAQAIDWLVVHGGRADDVWIARELGLVRSEIDRARSRARLGWWEDLARTLNEKPPRFLVAGVLGRHLAGHVDVAAVPEVAKRYTVQLRVGEQPTIGLPGWWRGNRQIVYVLQRNDPGVP